MSGAALWVFVDFPRLSAAWGRPPIGYTTNGGIAVPTLIGTWPDIRAPGERASIEGCIPSKSGVRAGIVMMVVIGLLHSTSIDFTRGHIAIMAGSREEPAGIDP